MEHLSVKKAINLARNFGAAGVLAAARQTIIRRQFGSPILITRRKTGFTAR